MIVNTRFACGCDFRRGFETTSSIATRIFFAFVGCGAIGMGVAALVSPHLTLSRTTIVVLSASGSALVLPALFIKRVKECIKQQPQVAHRPSSHSRVPVTRGGDVPLTLADLESDTPPLTRRDIQGIIQRAKAARNRGNYIEALKTLHPLRSQGLREGTALWDVCLKKLVQTSHAKTLSLVGVDDALREAIQNYLEGKSYTVSVNPRTSQRPSGTLSWSEGRPKGWDSGRDSWMPDTSRSSGRR